jgi:mono/diheme cytochrome c family protein
MKTENAWIVRTMTHWLIMTTLVLFSVACTPPVNATDYNGADLYQLNCSNCHGIYGEGDGAVTPDLSVVLLDLRYLSDRNDDVYPREFVTDIIDGRATRAAHGPASMPVWGVEFSRTEGLDQDATARVTAKIDALVDYLESIQLED